MFLGNCVSFLVLYLQSKQERNIKGVEGTAGVHNIHPPAIETRINQQPSQASRTTLVVHERKFFKRYREGGWAGEV